MKNGTSLSTRVFYAVTFSTLILWGASFALQEYFLDQVLDATAIDRIRFGFQLWFGLLIGLSLSSLAFAFFIQKWMYPLQLLLRWTRRQEDQNDSTMLIPPAPNALEGTPPEVQQIVEKVRSFVLRQKNQLESMNANEKKILDWEASAAYLYTTYNLISDFRKKEAEQAIQKESLKQMQEFAKHLLGDLRIAFSRIHHQLDHVALESPASSFKSKLKSLQMDLGTVLTQFEAYQEDAGKHAELLEKELQTKKTITQSTLFLSDEISEALLSAFPMELQEKYEVKTQLQALRNIKANVSSHFFQSIIGRVFVNLEKLWQESPSYKFKILLRANVNTNQNTWKLEMLSNASAFEDELIPEGLPKLLAPFEIQLFTNKISAQDEVWGYRVCMTLQGKIEEKIDESSSENLKANTIISN